MELIHLTSHGHANTVTQVEKADQIMLDGTEINAKCLSKNLDRIYQI
jgi:hypothetical protein